MTKVYKITPTAKCIGICHGSMLVGAMSEDEAMDIFYGLYGDTFNANASEVDGLVFDGEKQVIENSLMFTSNFLASLL